MVDKVKPLKIENPANGGTQTDPFPRESNPNEDFLAVKGIAFENLDTFLLEKLGRSIVEKFPTLYHKITYSSGNVATVAFYNSNSFVNANRVAQYDMTYTGNNLTSEALKIYDSDGISILRTYTWTHTYVGDDFDSTGLVIV